MAKARAPGIKSLKTRNSFSAAAPAAGPTDGDGKGLEHIVFVFKDEISKTPESTSMLES